MSADLSPPPYGFCIDTDTYAGNFERELCAYITGQIGECKVGQADAELAEKELNEEELKLFDEIITTHPDDHGCHRPVSIFPTPGFFNDGYGRNGQV